MIKFSSFLKLRKSNFRWFRLNGFNDLGHLMIDIRIFSTFTMPHVCHMQGSQNVLFFFRNFAATPAHIQYCLKFKMILSWTWKPNHSPTRFSAKISQGSHSWPIPLHLFQDNLKGWKLQRIGKFFERCTQFKRNKNTLKNWNGLFQVGWNFRIKVDTKFSC